ncbi:MAG: NAD(P)/FAD-dependent oxidoreductase [Chitinophagaceae bacterium]|nr:NAD(P)/FAD-dependent oxidoreductase [Chitinophagaceae bacterium]
MKKTTSAPEKKLKIVLVGNGPVGFKFCEKFVKYRLSKSYDLVVYGEETYPAYDRINLTSFFTEPIAEKLMLAPAAWYTQHKIVLKTGEQVIEINRPEKWIRTAKGTIEKYDRLVLATGSNPFVPPIENKNIPGVFVYRTLPDLVAIKEYIQPQHKAVVVGGGILGLEAARALANMGLHTTVIEVAPHLMAKQLDEEGAALLQQHLVHAGLHVCCNKQVHRITGDAKTEAIVCADGTVLAADVVVISAGIRPRDELARECGLTLGEHGGITVNNYNLTSDGDIYAIGECAFAAGKIWGLAAPCFEMAEVVAARLAKIYKVFLGNAFLITLKIMDVRVISFGDALGTAPHTPLLYIDKNAGVYKRVNISPDGRYVLGGMMIGDTGGYSALFNLLRNKIKIATDLSELIDPGLGGLQQRVIDLPDNAIICLCEGVTKGAIVADIKENGCTRLDEVKKGTNAGTGCESCTALLEEILAEMNAQH